jgi:Nucleotidyl transferase AbiEii toxin, Type IV TA system
VRPLPQVEQQYFKLLPFKPAAIPSLATEEVVAEKVRAASQRSKIRDLHDLSEIGAKPLDRDLLRSLAVIKLWESDKDNLDYARFVAQIENGKDYDLGDLTNLLRKDQRPDLKDMMRRAKKASAFSSRRPSWRARSRRTRRAAALLKSARSRRWPSSAPGE